MREQDVFNWADQALERAVEQIHDNQWSMPVTPVFANNTGLPTLRDVVRHMAYDEAWVPELLAGRTMDEVGRYRYDGDLLGNDPKGNYARIAAAARRAAGTIVDLERPVHCSYGDASTEEYLWQLIVARSLQADAIADAIGVDSPLTDELAQSVWEGLQPRAVLWRQVGVLFAEVPVLPDAPIRARLLGLAGQRP